MKEISENQVLAKMESANPWWSKVGDTAVFSVPFNELNKRRYFDVFSRLASQRSPHRALILMGPRRVGKTVLVFQLIRSLIENGHEPDKLIYIDLQQPLYAGLGLEQLLQIATHGLVENPPNVFVFFDEIQYLKDWELHLKALVDSFPNIKFVATGSAASALKKKSAESGAGRFTDFLLPPLTFCEFLDLRGKSDLVEEVQQEGRSQFDVTDIEKLNEHFLDYLNFGGYPEAVFSEEIQSDLARYIRNDIIDKVLLKDLPSLYGIQDIQELNSLFTTLAYNTANEVSLAALSSKSGVAKNTIKKYIEYLESAFLIKVVHRIDNNAKRFVRATSFKVYLTNPSIRSALFAPVTAEDQEMGDLVETAVFAQWFHSLNESLHYARWKNGEVDIVKLDQTEKPLWIVEVKWSDRYEENPNDLKSLKSFCMKHPDCFAKVTTRTKRSTKSLGEMEIDFMPASLYCYILGSNIIKGKGRSAFATS